MDDKKSEFELISGLRERLADGAQTEDEVIIMQLMKLIQSKNESLKEANNLLRESREEIKQVEESAKRDALTGLYNRKAIKPYFDKLLEPKIDSPENNLKSLQVIAIDLDHFKSINDVYGHDVGDDALKIVSEGLSRTFRKKDLIVRDGGDEFLVVVKNCDPSVLRFKIDNMCEYIRYCVNKDLDSRTKLIDGKITPIERPYDYTVSCGINEMNLENFNTDLLSDSEAFEEWFTEQKKVADEESYAVKEEHHAVR